MGVNLAYSMAHASQMALIRDLPGTPSLFESVDIKPHMSLALAGRGLQFHSHAENWFLQVAGKKAWWLSAPNEDPWHEPALPGCEHDPCVGLDPKLAQAPH